MYVRVSIILIISTFVFVSIYTILDTHKRRFRVSTSHVKYMSILYTVNMYVPAAVALRICYL